MHNLLLQELQTETAAWLVPALPAHHKEELQILKSRTAVSYGRSVFFSTLPCQAGRYRLQVLGVLFGLVSTCTFIF